MTGVPRGRASGRYLAGMRDILVAVYLLLPAGIANSVPPIATRLLGPGRPIHVKLFGAHKTWQGLLFGTVAGVITFYIQRAFDAIHLPLLFGIAISAGALIGDLVKSFVKRRLHVPPGKPWFPFDQCDYVLGALIAAAPFIHLTLAIVIGTIAVYVLLHLIVSAGGYLIGVKDSAI